MFRRVLPIATSLMLASCFTTPLSPHKIDIQQGNYVDQEMVAKLKPGMTRAQVRYVLGTPLVADPFHSNRWDYVYRLQKNGGAPEERKMTIVFEDDKLAQIDGDVVPGEVAEDTKPRMTKVVAKTPAGAAGPTKKEPPVDTSLKEKIESLIAEKGNGKNEAELRESLVKLLGVEERDVSDLPRAKPADGKAKAPPEPKQATSDLPKTKTKKVAKAKNEDKSAEKMQKAESNLRASGLSAGVLSALGVRYQGDGKENEEEVEVEEAEDEDVKPAKKKRVAKGKSGLKADGLSADVLRSLGIPFEGDGSENAAEGDEAADESVAESEAAEEEKPGVLDELKNAEGKSVREQLAEKFRRNKEEAQADTQRDAPEKDTEQVAETPTFMDDVRTVLGMGPAEKAQSGKSKKLAKKSAKEEEDEEEVDEGDVDEEEDETPQKPTFWEDVRTVLGLD
jgi:outer membrane protein assembly factor BamE